MGDPGRWGQPLATDSQGSRAAGIQKGWFPAVPLQMPGSSVNPGKREVCKQGSKRTEPGGWYRRVSGLFEGSPHGPEAKALPCNISSALSIHSHSHHRLLAPLALSLAKAKVSYSSCHRRPMPLPFPAWALLQTWARIRGCWS